MKTLRSKIVTIDFLFETIPDNMMSSSSSRSIGGQSRSASKEGLYDFMKSGEDNDLTDSLGSSSSDSNNPVSVI